MHLFHISCDSYYNQIEIIRIQINILYVPGLFPRYSSKNEPINGGIPQLADFGMHRETFYKELNSTLKDAFEGKVIVVVQADDSVLLLSIPGGSWFTYDRLQTISKRNKAYYFRVLLNYLNSEKDKKCKKVEHEGNNIIISEVANGRYVLTNYC